MVNWGMEIYSPASYFPKSDWILLANKDGKWTMEENKIFEKALAIHDKETPDRWQKIEEMIPGKSLEEVRRHYKVLEDDVSHIEAGLVPIPGYTSSSFTLEWVNTNGFDGFKQAYGVSGRRGGGGRPSDHERKKGIPWTEEEHKRFLMGLKKYGKGDWRNISRNFVISRTPTQVASHAQKYFIRLSSGGKDKRRSSIHDITTVNLPDERTPSPSKTQALLPNHPNSAETTDPNQSKGGPAFFKSMASNANNLLMQNHYGNNPYGIKFEPQNSHQSNIFESEVGHQDMFFQMQPSWCYPHG